MIWCIRCIWYTWYVQETWHLLLLTYNNKKGNKWLRRFDLIWLIWYSDMSNTIHIVLRCDPYVNYTPCFNSLCPFVCWESLLVPWQKKGGFGHILIPIFSSSHLLIFSSSHLLIFISSRLLVSLWFSSPRLSSSFSSPLLHLSVPLCSSSPCPCLLVLSSFESLRSCPLVLFLLSLYPLFPLGALVFTSFHVVIVIFIIQAIPIIVFLPPHYRHLFQHIISSSTLFCTTTWSGSLSIESASTVFRSWSHHRRVSYDL